MTTRENRDRALVIPIVDHMLEDVRVSTAWHLGEEVSAHCLASLDQSVLLDDKKSFGCIIRARRRELNLTQEELVRRIKTSFPYVGLLETEKRHPSERVVARLADALALDARELFLLANPGTTRLISEEPECNGTSAWEAFRKNESFHRLHNISEPELQALSQVALLGNVRSPRDFLFILNTIRQALASWLRSPKLPSGFSATNLVFQ